MLVAYVHRPQEENTSSFSVPVAFVSGTEGGMALGFWRASRLTLTFVPLRNYSLTHSQTVRKYCWWTVNIMSASNTVQSEAHFVVSLWKRRQTDRQTDANDICRVRVDYDAGFLINSMTNILVRMYNTHCRALKHWVAPWINNAPVRVILSPPTVFRRPWHWHTRTGASELKSVRPAENRAVVISEVFLRGAIFWRLSLTWKSPQSEGLLCDVKQLTV